MPFIPHTEEDVAAMLAAIGVDSIDDLFDEIPPELRARGLEGIPRGLSEMEVARLMQARAREDGLVRAHGVSCHTLGALESAAESDWVQVDLARINPAGLVMDADVPTVEKILNRMNDQGKAVIGMKVFGAGRLRHKTDESLQYVLSLNSVNAFTIGQENQTEMRQLIQKIPAASVRG